MNPPNPNGKRYNRLTIVSELPPRVYPYGKYQMVLCVCDCGKEVPVRLSKIKCGWTKSCGCLQVEAVVRKNLKHGMTGSGSYKTWMAMKERCSTVNQDNYKHYGGKGITVCEDWLDSFDNFYRDMGDRPLGKSIDRIDNSKGYSKSNCRWATAKEQANNRGNGKQNKQIRS